jgi:hypothetical protein
VLAAPAVAKLLALRGLLLPLLLRRNGDKAAKLPLGL